MRKFSVPCVISLLVAALYNIVDQMFIANAAYLGSCGNAANESLYYTEFAVRSFRTYLCMMVLACVNKAAFIFLQSLGRPWVSTMLSVVREVVFGVGFALLLPRFFGLDGVLYSMPVSDMLTFILSVIVIVDTYKKLSARQTAAP